jgi:signal peptidase
VETIVKKKLLNLSLGTALTGVFLLLAAVTLLPRTAGWHFLTVLTPSMSPTLGVGAVVAVRPVDPLSIQQGEIIVYRPPDSAGVLVTHRVVEVVGQGGRVGFRTRGDANNVADGYTVPAGSVIGRVALHIPLLGYLLAFVRTPLGLIATIVVPSLALVLMEGSSAVRQAKRQGVASGS